MPRAGGWTKLKLPSKTKRILYWPAKARLGAATQEKNGGPSPNGAPELHAAAGHRNYCRMRPKMKDNPHVNL